MLNSSEVPVAKSFLSSSLFLASAEVSRAAAYEHHVVNSSVFYKPGADPYLWTKLTLVAVSFVVSAMGNMFIFLAFAVHAPSRSQQTSTSSSSTEKTVVVDLIFASLALVGCCRAVCRGPLQAASLLTGTWEFGSTFCQLQGFLDDLFRHLFVWYLSLLSLERYTKYLKTHEYAVTFSSLNVKVVLPGMFLLVITQVTGPIYGWGEFAYVPEVGLCHLHMDSNFGCSYILYILSSLSLPPTIVMLLCLASLGLKDPEHRMTHSGSYDSARCLLYGRSRVLNVEKEPQTLWCLGVAYSVLNAPRCITDALVSCEMSSPLPSFLMFFSNWMEGASVALLPLVCVCLHQRLRLTLWNVLVTRCWSISETSGLTQDS